MYGRYYGNSELARDSEDANAERVYRVADAMAFAYGLERKARECNTTPDCAHRLRALPRPARRRRTPRARREVGN